MKYLYLNDLPDILGKSWSFCQKEVSKGVLKGVKQNIGGKLRYIIKREDLNNYILENQMRIGKVDNHQLDAFEFDINNPEATYKKNKENKKEEEKTVVFNSQNTKLKNDEDQENFKNEIKILKETIESFKVTKENNNKNLENNENNRIIKILENQIKEKDNNLIGIKESLEAKIIKLEQEKGKINLEREEVMKKNAVLADNFAFNLKKFFELGDGKTIKLGELKTPLHLIQEENTLINGGNIVLDGNLEIEKSRKEDFLKLEEKNKKFKVTIIILLILFTIIGIINFSLYKGII